MKTRPLSFVLRSLRSLLPLLLLCVLAPAAALHAQLTKIFVASTGNDANDGSRGAPKRNFQPAQNAVAAGGQIVVLDTAGYGPLTINKSISVTVPPGVNGFITVTGNNNGIIVAAATTDVVSLRGLIIEGGSNASGSNSKGIFSSSVDTLRLEDCTIRNFEFGVYLYNSNGAHLVARGCSVRDVQTGFEVRSASVNTTVDGVCTNCTVDNAAGTTFNAAFYVEADAATSVAKITVSGCVATDGGIGLKAYGSGASLYADTCVVSGNTTGVSAANSGLAFTRGNNVFTNNGADGSFTSSLAAK